MIQLPPSWKMGGNRVAKFSTKALANARRKLVSMGLTYSQFGAIHGIKSNTVKDLLAGRLAARRGASHKAAVALGLKKPPSTWNWNKLSNAGQFIPSPSPIAAPELATLSLGSAPTKIESRQIEVLRHYNGRPVAVMDALDNLAGTSPPEAAGNIDSAELVELHGFKMSTLRLTLRRYSGKPVPPTRQSVAWLILAAASCQKGVELCCGLAEQIHDLRCRFPEQFFKKSAKKRRPK